MKYKIGDTVQFDDDGTIRTGTIENYTVSYRGLHGPYHISGQDEYDDYDSTMFYVKEEEILNGCNTALWRVLYE